MPRRPRSEEHTSELQSPCNLVFRLLLETKNIFTDTVCLYFFFFNDTVITYIYPLPLSDDFPVWWPFRLIMGQERRYRRPLCLALVDFLAVVSFFFFKEQAAPRVLPSSPPRPSPD